MIQAEDPTMIDVSASEPIYKILVRGSLIESNAAAKRLIKERAVTINFEDNYRSIAHVIELADTARVLGRAARLKFYLRIGKRVLEPLELIEWK